MDTAVLALRTVLALVVVVGLVVVLGRVLDDRTSGRSQDGFVSRLVGPFKALLPGSSRGQAAPRRRRPAAVLTLVGRQGLGPKASVAVVDVGAQRLVLGVSEAGVTLLTTMDAPAPEATEAAEPLVLDEARAEPEDQPQVSAVPAAVAPAPAFDEVFAGIVGPGASTVTDHPAPEASDGAPVHGSRDAALVPGRSAVDGSILSPATWRQAVTAVQTRTRR